MTLLRESDQDHKVTYFVIWPGVTNGWRSMLSSCFSSCRMWRMCGNMESNMLVSKSGACWKGMKGKKEHHTTGQGASSPSRPGRPGSPFSPLKPRKPCLWHQPFKTRWRSVCAPIAGRSPLLSSSWPDAGTLNMQGAETHRNRANLKLRDLNN